MGFQRLEGTFIIWPLDGVEYWICFEWNKHRCMYVHWRIYSSRDSGYITAQSLSECEVIYIGKYTGIYIHTTIAWAKWEMLLKTIDSEEFIELQLHEKLPTVRTNVWIVIPLFASHLTPVSVNDNLHWLLLIKQLGNLLNVIPGLSTFTWQDRRWI